MLFSGLGVASAHVSLTPGEAPAGSSTIVTLALSHGCDGSSTTQISISVPDEVETIAPGMNYGWTVETVADDAATPAADGHDATGRTSEIIYTAKEPLPDGIYDQFLLQVRVPDDMEGDTLYFPTIQTCEEGETAWIQIPADGQDPDELDDPAPSLTVTAPVEGGH